MASKYFDRRTLIEKCMQNNPDLLFQERKNFCWKKYFLKEIKFDLLVKQAKYS